MGRRGWFLAVTAAIVACSTAASVPDTTDGGPDASTGNPDAGGGDGGGPTDAFIDVETTYHGLSANNFSSFDTSTKLNAAANSFLGGAYDGRYVYFSPAFSPARRKQIIRYDTAAPFDDVTSWSTFALAVIAPNGGQAAGGGAVFDGRRVTFIPYRQATSAGIGLFVSYDPSKPFTDPASWSLYDATSANPAAVAFIGGAFDGKNVYFGQEGPLVARHDTTASFSDPQAWTFFDLADAGGGNFFGAVFDGTGIELVPASGLMARYTTAQPFNSVASWSRADLSSAAPGQSFMLGAAFDGRFVYMAPLSHTAPDGGVDSRLPLVRIDP